MRMGALVLLLCLCWSPLRAAGPHTPVLTTSELLELARSLPSVEKKEPQRLVATTLAVTLGIFGAHRLYLGTSTKVPIVYGLTFGGFGVLALIDLGHILFSKDLDAYRNDGNILMWADGASGGTTPP